MKHSAVAVITLYLLLYIAPLGVRPLFIPDETRYFEIPREMIASGDWVVPRLNGIRYFEKPVLGYWLIAASMLAFGENAFAVRFPSAVAAGISALAVFALARRFAGGYLPAITAVGIFLTSLEVLGIGTFSVLDGPVSLFITLAMASFFLAHQSESGSGQKALRLSAFGFFCGLAFLTKGFISFAVPVVCLVPFLIWERRLWEYVKSAWLPLTVAVLTVLPWSLMIHFREGDFWRYFFWVEHIQRFLSPPSGQHPEPFWYYIPVLLAGSLPWAVLFPAAYFGLRKIDFGDSLVRFAVCWFLFPFLFFSASSGKLATYILPCFPALSLLMAMGLRKYFQENGNRAFSAGALSMGILTGFIAVAFVLNQATGFAGIKPFGPSETWKWIIAATGLVFWSAFSFYGFRLKTASDRLVCFGIGPLMLFFSAHFIIPDMTLVKKAPGELITRNRHLIGPDTIIIADGDLIRAVCAFLERDDAYMIIARDELKYGLSYADSENRMLPNTEDVLRVIDGNTPESNEANSENRSVAVIARPYKLKRFNGMLPKPDFSDQTDELVFLLYSPD